MSRYRSRMGNDRKARISHHRADLKMGYREQVVLETGRSLHPHLIPL